jgi:hypothetical protein
MPSLSPSLPYTQKYFFLSLFLFELDFCIFLNGIILFFDVLMAFTVYLVDSMKDVPGAIIHVFCPCPCPCPCQQLKKAPEKVVKAKLLIFNYYMNMHFSKKGVANSLAKSCPMTE